METTFVMSLGSLIDKLLRGEIDEWCEADFYFYIENLTHSNKKMIQKVLESVDESIANWKNLSFISYYEDRVNEYRQGQLSWDIDELDDLFNNEEYLRKEGKNELTVDFLFSVIVDRGFINESHQNAVETAWINKDIQFLKKEWEDLVLTQIRSFRNVVFCRLKTTLSESVNDKRSTKREIKRLADYPEEFNIKVCSDFTGYAVHTLYKFISKKDIPCYRRKDNGRNIYFKRDEVYAWKMAYRQGTNEEYIEEMNGRLAAKAHNLV